MGAIFEGSGSWINYVTYFFMLSHPVSYHGITARPLIYLVIFLVQYLHVRASSQVYCWNSQQEQLFGVNPMLLSSINFFGEK